jgi:hypothetical protein
MAIVQISRIQVRRGRENSDTGIPQLASGEIAWAIDTQQLYIGNGAVSEGAPAVGNTKILTSSDLVGERNILNVADYTYKKDTTLPSRPVQDRLDDRVNFYSFNDLRSSQNKSMADNIQSAIDFLYSSSIDDRAILEFSPGIYEFDTPINIPSFASIKGAGVGRTIFKFKSSEELNAFNLIDADNVSLSGFTLIVEMMASDTFNNGPAAMTLNNVKDSQFRDLAIKGYWENDRPGNFDQKVNSIAVKMLSICENNQFDNATISYFRTGIDARGANVKSNIIKNSKFINNQVSINFGQINDLPEQGPSNNIITNCFFNEIEKQGIKIYSGKGNVSSQNKFTLVGDNFGNSSNAQYGVVEFDTPTNLVINDQSDRHDDLANGFLLRPYISEIIGKANYTNPFTNVLSLQYTVTPMQFLRLPVAQTCHLEVEYLYQSTNQNRLRRGKLSILVDTEHLDQDNNPILELVDDYDYLGLGLETNYTMEDVHLIFTASIQTYFGSRYVVNFFYQYDGGTTVSQGDQARFTYTYKILS